MITQQSLSQRFPAPQLALEPAPQLSDELPVSYAAKDSYFSNDATESLVACV